MDMIKHTAKNPVNLVNPVEKKTYLNFSLEALFVIPTKEESQYFLT
jgi:hypothetical protein